MGLTGDMLSDFLNKYGMVVVISAVVVIVGLVAIHTSGHLGSYSVCLLIVCALILTSTGVIVPLGVFPFTIQVLVNQGATIPYRLERPPRI